MNSVWSWIYASIPTTATSSYQYALSVLLVQRSTKGLIWRELHWQRKSSGAANGPQTQGHEDFPDTELDLPPPEALYASTACCRS